MVDDLKDIKRNTGKFSFTDTVASLVNNRQWRAGHDLLKSGEQNDKTYFWECLSAVGEEIGEVIYDNVVNYIDNVANINTCKIHALKSIATVLGIKNFAILGNIEQVPLDVLNMIDVFSINRAYLLNVRNFDTDFVRDLFESTLDQDSLDNAKRILSTEAYKIAAPDDEHDTSVVFGLSGFLPDADLSNVFIAGNVSVSAYENYIEECFFKLLTSKIFQRYGDEPNLSGDLIFLNLKDNDDFEVDDSLEYMRHSDNSNAPYTKNILWYKDQDSAVNGIGGSFSNRIPGLYQTNYANYIYRLKRSLNVAPWFNQRLIADKIENGFDFIDNYSGGELSVIQAELNERAKPKYSDGYYSSDRPTTRYSYYDELEVKKYIRFVDGIFSLSTFFNRDNYSEPYNPYNLANVFSPYGLDDTFSDITNAPSEYGLLSNITDCQNAWISADEPLDDSLSNFLLNYYTDYDYNSGRLNNLRVVAKILKDICLAIVDIRERLKTQSQRNYMVGTKLLIEYILNEYLANSLIKNYGVDPKEVYEKFGALIIEYNDTTEYFNIGAMPDDVNLMASVNYPYWRSLSTDPFNGQQGGNGLPEEDIKNFYLSSLNIRNTSWRNCISDDTYYDFMSAVYDLGKSESYYSLDKGLLVTNKERFLEGAELKLDALLLFAEYGLTKPEISALQRDFLISSDEGYLTIDYALLEEYGKLSDNLNELSATVAEYNNRLSICYAQQEEITLKYHGADIFYYPWYNYKNQVYPTFQTHPYMYNFIEHTNVSYPIENAFYGNANEDLIAELQSKNISVYLEQFGNIVRVWRNSNFDYSGYKSRYEASTHNVNVFSNPSRLYSVTHYDGTFYPPALKLYKQYLNEELNRVKQTQQDIEENGYKLLGWERLSVDLLCTSFYGNEDDLENLTVATISNMWHYYSHLDLTMADKQKIYNQLVNLSAYLSDVSTDDTYDIYRYGLDFNMDSFVLYKKYENGLSATYSEKKETPGQLWVRFNNHPIGFPAFIVDSELSQYSQFDWLSAFGTRSINDSLCSYVFEHGAAVTRNASDPAPTSPYQPEPDTPTPEPQPEPIKWDSKSPSLFYDFELASSGRYLLLATKNYEAPEDNQNYANALVFAGSISEHKTIDYKNPENERTYFNLLTYGNECLYPSNATQLSDMVSSKYEFMGFFQNNYTVYSGYVRRFVSDGALTSIGLNAIEYPAGIAQSNNSESYNFTFSRSWKQPLLTPADIASLSTPADAQIVLGYSDFDENFSLVVRSEMLETSPIVVQDYTARQTVENLSGFGKTEVLFGTEDVDGERTSFDRFDNYITIYDIGKTAIEKGSTTPVSPLVYGLNADASWIPLYPGLSGQNLQYRMLSGDNGGSRISYNESWHELSIAKESIELLGHSYKDLDIRFAEYESTIVEDSQTKKSTNYDLDSVLDATIRVYEDFEEEACILDTYSQPVRYSSADASSTLTTSIVVGDPISAELSRFSVDELSSEFNRYRVILVNALNGKNLNPIVVGKFCYETFETLHYDFESTYEERYILSNAGFRQDRQICIAGTQNPFDSTGNLAYEIGTSNHVFNVSELSTTLERSDDGVFTVEIKLTVSDPNFSFTVPTGQFRLFVYKDTLEEFEKFHYMEPFGHFPYNAAVSSWSKVPWKDKDYGFLYYGGYTASADGWWPISDYVDMRNSVSSHYHDLYALGAQDFQTLGQLPPRKTVDDVSPTLSLMDKIDLSSISSFDEQYFLSTGQITFKMSEEDRFSYLRSAYPPTAIDRLLYALFKDTSKSYRASNVLDLSNTYVFQLEDPDRIAKLIGDIAIPIYDSIEESIIAYEEYLSDAVRIDVNGVEALSDYEFFDIPTSGVWSLTAEDVPTDSHSFPTEAEDSGTIDRLLSALALSGGCLHGTEARMSDAGAIDYVLTSVTGKDICDYLKVYANWRWYEDGNGVDEIELFFNVQNLFSSPYHYKMENGYYAVEFKKNTYLRLKSGENDYLYIVLQFKYYDMNRNLVGIRDLPILTYRIYNLSDDKPKFLFVKTYEIDNSDGKYTYSTDDKPKVYIVVNEKKYGLSDLSNYIDWDYTIKRDFQAETSIEVLTPIPLSTLDLEFVYERGKMADSAEGYEDPEFVLETNHQLTYPGKFVDESGMVSCSIGSARDVRLGYSLLKGASIDENLLERYFPIELINAYGVNVNGVVPEFVFIDGGIDFNISGNDVLPGLYLGREANIISTGSEPPGPEPPGPGPEPPGPGPEPPQPSYRYAELVIELSSSNINGSVITTEDLPHPSDGFSLYEHHYPSLEEDVISSSYTISGSSDQLSDIEIPTSTFGIYYGDLQISEYAPHTVGYLNFVVLQDYRWGFIIYDKEPEKLDPNLDWNTPTISSVYTLYLYGKPILDIEVSSIALDQNVVSNMPDPQYPHDDTMNYKVFYHQRVENALAIESEGD